MKGQDVILGMLIDKPRTGYEIKREFENLFPDFFVATFGTIYPTLNKMEKEAYITREIVQQEGKPNKNVYAITEKGRELFYAYLDSPLEPKSIRYDFIMRLFFGHHSSQEQLLQLIDEEMLTVEEGINRLHNILQDKEKKWHPVQELCWHIGLEHHEAFLQSLKKIKDKIKNEND
ncbi:PadR family transcriptional regulator [Heliorestis acidaminivorans]|uniref:PadR family transcriptional regulator n=1 Tax=Heliorestis acidaminivorans TaxID=553427 RepID=UPI001478BBBC|nr:PadR family transcriptional regulator [Heliorestis acidaminivorans]